MATAICAYQLLYGRISDLIGQKNLLYSSMVIFATGSLLCGVTKSILWLIIARGVAGLGGEELAKWLQALSVTWSCSAIAGPLLGGFFSSSSSTISWRWASHQWYNTSSSWCTNDIIFSGLIFGFTFLRLNQIGNALSRALSNFYSSSETFRTRNRNKPSGRFPYPRLICQLGLKHLSDFFRSPVTPNFTKYLTVSFLLFISPQLPLLDKENTQAPTFGQVWRLQLNVPGFCARVRVVVHCCVQQAGILISKLSNPNSEDEQELLERLVSVIKSFEGVSDCASGTPLQRVFGTPGLLREEEEEEEEEDLGIGKSPSCAKGGAKEELVTAEQSQAGRAFRRKGAGDNFLMMMSYIQLFMKCKRFQEWRAFGSKYGALAACGSVYVLALLATLDWKMERVSYKTTFYDPSILANTSYPIPCNYQENIQWTQHQRRIIKDKNITVHSTEELEQLIQSFYPNGQKVPNSFITNPEGTIASSSKEAAPLQSLHFSSYNCYTTKGKDAPTNVHPRYLVQEDGRRVNYSQMLPYPSGDIQKFPSLYNNLQKVFSGALSWIEVLVKKSLPDEYATLAKVIDILPGQPRSSVSPWLSWVVNINLCTEAHRDIGDSNICLILPIGSFQGAELVLLEQGLVVGSQETLSDVLNLKCLIFEITFFYFVLLASDTRFPHGAVYLEIQHVLPMLLQ
ncbi:hypothetical protein SERLADRAFT_412378 [Serpula lacrymans var. lacrymans S7.9]|uniref:U3 small nucleolar RNA-associated protein 20 N-terminal domain-containing protein n=1 Tax=Serpula lacrymans var. lacrymans (strain S7.9) TaxID=578457 RepID=F8NEL4_SERL9|nr:uncharacterized protein SERLADRAFT_412378 [Serpula lacrymans var. lacrymans S7.9]EGO30648.1 hypothetical protein SERLADRAFT_412378 [Serpula lacrymans var. lacrymans S7.9]